LKPHQKSSVLTLVEREVSQHEIPSLPTSVRHLPSLILE